MQRLIKTAVKALVAVVLACATQARAEYKTWYDGKLTWTYRLDDEGKAELYNNGSSVIPTTTQGDVTVPSQIDGHDVGLVGVGAFSGCAYLTGLTIPDEINFPESALIDGGGIFTGCTRLKKLSAPPELVLYSAVIDGFYDMMFPDCPTDLLLSAVVAGDDMVVHMERQGAAGKTWSFATGLLEVSGAALVGMPLEDFGMGEGVLSACLPVPTGDRRP